jgi:hypothetical protein
MSRTRSRIDGETADQRPAVPRRTSNSARAPRRASLRR